MLSSFYPARDYVAALRFPWPCATGDLTTERRAAACGPGLLLSRPPPYGRKRPTDEDKKNSARYPSGASFCCDPVGIRTQDPQLRRLLLYHPQLRRLLLYPTELPDRSVCCFTLLPWESKADAKIEFIIGTAKNNLCMIAGACMNYSARRRFDIITLAASMPMTRKKPTRANATAPPMCMSIIPEYCSMTSGARDAVDSAGMSSGNWDSTIVSMLRMLHGHTTTREPMMNPAMTSRVSRW